MAKNDTSDALPVLMVISDQQDFYYREYGDTASAADGDSFDFADPSGETAGKGGLFEPILIPSYQHSGSASDETRDTIPLEDATIAAPRQESLGDDGDSFVFGDGDAAMAGHGDDWCDLLSAGGSGIHTPDLKGEWKTEEGEHADVGMPEADGIWIDLGSPLDLG